MVKRLLWFILFAGILSAGIVSAQSTTPPLWVTTLDSVWLWSGADAKPQMVVNQQANVIFSPDGKQVAFTLWTDRGLDWAIDDFNVANEIWVADAVTGEMTQLVGQPADSSEEQFVLLSDPSWSPDSTRLIWTEVAYPSYDEKVIIADVASGAQTEFLTGLKAEGDVPRAAVDWSASGIALDKTVFFADGSQTDSETIFIYNDQGKLQSRTLVGDAHPGFSYGHVWIMDGDSEKLAVLYDDGSWLMIDPTTGDAAPMSGSAALYSTTAADSLSIDFELNADQDFNVSAVQAETSSPLGTVNYMSQLFSTATIAPDGKAAAVQLGGSVMTWPAGDTIAVGGGDYSDTIIRLAWGPVSWRVKPG